MATEQPKKWQLDTQLNKTAVDLVTYSVIGYGFGVLASIFFKRKTFIRSLGAGFGGGYVFNENRTHFSRKIASP